MPDALPFNKEDLNKVNTHLLIGLLAQQQSIVEVISEHLNLPKNQIQEEILVIYSQKWTGILGVLYTQFGLTPDVLSPDKAG